ncbi:hypothetical protein ACOJBO_22915 [Rhizobium beringeri]
MRRLFGMGPRKRRQGDYGSPYDFNDDEFGTLNEPVRAKAPTVRGERMEPSMEPSMGPRQLRRGASFPRRRCRSMTTMIMTTTCPLIPTCRRARPISCPTTMTTTG